jgi:uncharacterized protein (TIGR03066 family)
MALLRAALAGCLLSAVGSAGPAQKAKVDSAKLVGTWTFVKTTAKRAPPPGAAVQFEFTRDGKLNVTSTVKGKTSRATGSYTLKGDRLTVVMVTAEKRDGKTVTKQRKETVTIAELTDKRLVTRRREDGKTITTEFKK